jgi:GNAT superfamily N-acetyltransferase
MLNGPQAALARWHGQAVRVDPDYGPFVATTDQSDAAQTDLAEIVRASSHPLWLAETEAWPAPAGTKCVRTAPLVQMRADRVVDLAQSADDIVNLGEDDVPAMRELALATEPGPWAAKTHKYAQFFGIRDGKKLAAMAGERMRPAVGLSEVSGVCTWPEYRGQGMARRLSAHVAAQQRARGDTPFLHAYSGNKAAVGLYENLGFDTIREMVVTVLEADG